MVVEVMRELSIDIAVQRSKSVEEIDLQRISTVISLTEEGAFPTHPPDLVRLHWPIEEPSGDNPEQRRAACRRVRDQLKTQVERYFSEHTSRRPSAV